MCLVPWGGLVPGGCLAETPRRMATAAGGTHPTGMHSCFSEKNTSNWHNKCSDTFAILAW